MEVFARWALKSPKFLSLYGKYALIRMPICLLIQFFIPAAIMFGGVWFALMDPNLVTAVLAFEAILTGTLTIRKGIEYAYKLDDVTGVTHF